MKADINLFQRISLFEGISDEDTASLLVCLKAYSRSYHKGEFILLDEDTVRNVGAVLTGTVHMLKEDIWGHKTLLAYMGAGEVFGETFAVKSETQSYVSYYAATDAKILFLSLEHLLHPCKRNCAFHGRLTENMFHLMGEKNMRLMEKIEITSKGSLREKILAYLSLQAQKQGKKYITVPLNRTEMASFLQANRSSLTREISEMKAEGIIDYDGNIFILKE